MCCSAVAWETHHPVCAIMRQAEHNPPYMRTRNRVDTVNNNVLDIGVPEETVEKTMLHSVSGLATMMRSTSVERHARMCEPRGTARARTANSVFDSGSNNFRNGMSGYLLNKQRKPGGVSRANNENNKLIGHGCPIQWLLGTEEWKCVHRRMQCHTSRRAILHRH